MKVKGTGLSVLLELFQYSANVRKAAFVILFKAVLALEAFKAWEELHSEFLQDEPKNLLGRL